MIPEAPIRKGLTQGQEPQPPIQFSLLPQWQETIPLAEKATLISGKLEVSALLWVFSFPSLWKKDTKKITTYFGFR